MKATLGLLAALTVLALAPSQAQAQRHRSGNVNTPYGTFTPQEMMAGGGDPSVAQEMRAEKLAMLQQQQYMAQYAKQQKAYQDYLKKHPEAAKNVQATTARPAKAAKKAKTKAGSASTSSTASTKATAKATPAKAVVGAPAVAKDADPD